MNKNDEKPKIEPIIAQSKLEPENELIKNNLEKELKLKSTKEVEQTNDTQLFENNNIENIQKDKLSNEKDLVEVKPIIVDDVNVNNDAKQVIQTDKPIIIDNQGVQNLSSNDRNEIIIVDQPEIKLEPKIKRTRTTKTTKANVSKGEKKNVLLNVKNLNVTFKVNRKKTIRIVRGIDLKILKGQIIGLVGESGSGKSVTSKALMNINDFAITESDEMMIGDISLKNLREKEWSQIRGKKIGYIPQDPLTSLNPTRTIGKQLLDVLKDSTEFQTKDEKINYLINLLESFGIRDAKLKFNSYPHTFSGGMKQRVVIAMIVAAKPELIIADEPTTALDPTVQASVLSLFEEIRTEFNISIIFISHNISVIAKFCDYIYVMYAGKIIEAGTKQDIFTRPAHPYTWALISSIPEDKDEKLFNIPGTPPDMANLPSGDPFAPRNKFALEVDFKKEPPLFQITKTHFAATWLLDKRSPKVEMTPQLKTRVDYFKKVFND